MATNAVPALKDRNMRIYIAGQFPSLLGTWMETAAILWQAAQVAPPDRKALYVGLIAALQTLPSVVLGPLGGALVDRYGLLKTYFATQTCAMLIAFVLAGAAFAHTVTVTVLMVCSILLGFVQILDRPAQNSLVGILVPTAHLRSATGLSTCMIASGMTVGSAAAGLVIAYCGVAWTYLANATSFVCVITALLFVHPVAGKDHKTSHPWQMFKEGARLITQKPQIATLLSLGGLALLLGNSYQKVLVILAEQMFNSDPRTYGYLLAAAGAGAISGGLWVGLRPSTHSPMSVASRTFFMTAFALLTFSGTHNLHFAYGELFVAGLALTTIHPVIRAELQEISGAHMLGRIMGWSVTFNFGAFTVGSFAAGALIQRFGSRTTMTMNGIAALAAGLVTLFILRKRK